MIYNSVSSCDSNNKYIVHPNSKIEGGHFLSTLDLQFQSNSISRLNYVHPNTTLGIWPSFRDTYTQTPEIDENDPAGLDNDEVTTDASM
jgi:hypothetical protein